MPEKKYIPKHRAKNKDVFVIFIFLKETKNSNFFDKAVLKSTSNAIFNIKKVALEES